MGVKDKKNICQDKTKAVQVLQTNLVTLQEWKKVHAAEFLIWSGYPEGVKEVFLEEEKLYGEKPQYRIGIWRVLAQVEKSKAQKSRWSNKILKAFLDEKGSDRIHAAETLAKLGISPLKDYPDITKRALESTQKNFSLYTRWSTSHDSKEKFSETQDFFLDLATNRGEKDLHRMVAAYVMQKLKRLTPAQWNKLAQAALHEAKKSEVRVNLICATLIAADDTMSKSILYKDVYNEFVEYFNSNSFSTRMKVAEVLAKKGSADDLQLLNSYLENIDSGNNDSNYEDVRSSAAYAILKISDRVLK